MAAEGTGIQELMAAETRASQIVAEARQGRGERMKQAKVEAQELISVYRAEKQDEFNNMVLSKGGSESSVSQKLQQETEKDVAEMNALFKKNQGAAVDVLLSKCCEVSLDVPSARVRSTQKKAGIVS